VAVIQTVSVSLHPITDADLPRVGAFLQRNLNHRVSAEHWASSLQVPWAIEKPNSGFMLLDDGAVVGAHLAFYSEREIDGRRERFCNLGAWCVLPEHRFHSLRLLKALLAQDGYHFTDLSPSGNVVGLNRRLRFRVLDTEVAFVPNLPWPSWPRRDVISSDPALIERTLSGRDLELYRDHAGASAGRHLVLIRRGEWCYVVFRKERRKGLPLFARVLYVSNPDLLRRMERPFARHLLLHHGALATFAEERVVKHRPRLSYGLRSPRQRMFRSPHLEPHQIDYLYSELVCVSW
jgi:hypothetical protein